MFDFDAGKVIIIGIVALIVIGPKELPRVMRQVGQATSKMRRMAAEFRSQFMESMREAELDAIESDVEKLAENAKAGSVTDPLAQIKAELTQAIDAADKRCTLPDAVVPTLAAPHMTVSAPNSSALPELPEEAEASGSYLAASIVPLAAGPGAAAPVHTPPATGAIDAEMQAVADALAAQMGETPPRRAAEDGEKSPDNR
jgi:sec-independent protein translocase protein TatB